MSTLRHGIHDHLEHEEDNKEDPRGQTGRKAALGIPGRCWTCNEPGHRSEQCFQGQHPYMVRARGRARPGPPRGPSNMPDFGYYGVPRELYRGQSVPSGKRG
ncbi:hypothetical protein XENOCAPTIV_021896, partial [Xenoophorus captivus]